MRWIGLALICVSIGAQLFAEDVLAFKRGQKLYSKETIVIADLEHQLAGNPEDENLRSTLISYYLDQHLEQERVVLVTWLIDHHPESTLHRYEMAATMLRFTPAEDRTPYQDAMEHWRKQVGLHPNDVRVVVNAARAMQQLYMGETVELLKRARSLSPATITDSLANLYATIPIYNLTTRPNNYNRDPALASEIRRALDASEDKVLIGGVASHAVERFTSLAKNGSAAWDMSAVKSVTVEMIERAERLDPRNPAWAELMHTMAALP
jgi:hypothetical protein